MIPRGFERAAGAAVDSAGLLAVETLQRGAPLSVLLVEDDLVIAPTRFCSVAASSSTLSERAALCCTRPLTSARMLRMR